MTRQIWFALAVVMLTASLAQAVPYEFNYSGRITETSGKPVDGPIDIKISFYHQETGGSSTVYVPPFSGVALDEGVFNVTITTLTAADYHQIFSDSSSVYVEVTDLTNSVTYPRQRFSVVPYALKVPVDGTTVTYDANGKLKVGMITNAQLDPSSYIKPGTGTAADCDATKEGMIRYNSSTKKGEICNGTAWTSMDGSSGGVPAGTIAFFNLATCPTGWTDRTATIGGRYVVGKPSGGTLTGTRGTALSDLEDRPVGQHNHTVNDPGHSHKMGSYLPNTLAAGANTSYPALDGTGPQVSEAKATGITLDSSGSVAGTNAPYIQYLACEKQ